ncbi:hypothetical protein J4G02_22870, partial [Candidatus Poribacteria bacterium]|nr:hypothetical protein [Candidatus Poribacteria bacterium]
SRHKFRLFWQVLLTFEKVIYLCSENLRWAGARPAPTLDLFLVGETTSWLPYCRSIFQNRHFLCRDMNLNLLLAAIEIP